MTLHVDDTSAADRTVVGIFHVFAIASMVDTVTTLHENYGLRRRKHVLATYRTVAISRAFDAAMSISNRY